MAKASSLYLFCLQSCAMCPEPPQIVQMMVLVMMVWACCSCFSFLCVEMQHQSNDSLRQVSIWFIFWPDFTHCSHTTGTHNCLQVQAHGFPCLPRTHTHMHACTRVHTHTHTYASPSFSLSVPFSSASSRSCCRLRSFCPSGTSIPCLMISLIFKTTMHAQPLDTVVWFNNLADLVQWRLLQANLLAKSQYLFYSLGNIFWIVGSDIGMQGLILSRQWLPILASNFAFLHRALASNDDLGTSLQTRKSTSSLQHCKCATVFRKPSIVSRL